MLRPSCIPWELDGREINGGKGQQCIPLFMPWSEMNGKQQGDAQYAGCTSCYQGLSTSDLCECHSSAVQQVLIYEGASLQICNEICVDVHIPCYHFTL